MSEPICSSSAVWVCAWRSCVCTFITFKGVNEVILLFLTLRGFIMKVRLNGKNNVYEQSAVFVVVLAFAVTVHNWASDWSKRFLWSKKITKLLYIINIRSICLVGCLIFFGFFLSLKCNITISFHRILFIYFMDRPCPGDLFVRDLMEREFMRQWFWLVLNWKAAGFLDAYSFEKLTAGFWNGIFVGLLIKSLWERAREMRKVTPGWGLGQAFGLKEEIGLI